MQIERLDLQNVALILFKNIKPMEVPKTKVIKKGKSMDSCQEKPMFKSICSKKFIYFFGKYNKRDKGKLSI